MGEGMQADLVSLVLNSLDGPNPFLGCVNFPFAVVVATDEEGCFCIFVTQDVQQLLGIL